MRRLLPVMIVVVCVLAPAAHARPGDLDRSFSKDGRLGFNPYGLGGTVRGLSLVDGRRPLLSVQAQRRSSVAPTWVALNAAGRITRRLPAPPPAFYAATVVDGHALTELASDFTTVRYGFGRAGSLDMVTLTFEAGAWIGPFRVDDQGRVVVAGGVKRQGRVWRFLRDGTPDPSFGGDGQVELSGYDDLGDLVPRRDGGLYVADSRRLTALDGSGNRLAGFRDRRVLPPRRGRSSYSRATRIVPAPGGRLLVVGQGDYGSRPWVARLRPNGRPDTSWGDRGYVARLPALRDASFSAAAFDRRGRIVLAGRDLGGPSSFSALVVRLTRGGRVDRAFATAGRKRFRLATVADVAIEASDINHVAVDTRGRIVLAGNVYDTEYIDREDYGSPYPAIARLKG